MRLEVIRQAMNRDLGRFLYSSRIESRSSAASIASSVGFSEAELLEIESKPSEVPCNQLYRLISHYGPSRIIEAQMLICETQAATLSLPMPEAKFSFARYLPVISAPKIFRTAGGFALGWALGEFLKGAFKNLLLGRLS